TAKLSSPLPLEELVGNAAGRLLARNVGFQAADFLLQKRNALFQLSHGEQGKILADFVVDLLLRTVVLVDGWHGSSEASSPLPARVQVERISRIRGARLGGHACQRCRCHLLVPRFRSS